MAEWAAAAVGLSLTLGVLGYLVREGLSPGDSPPSLSVESQPAKVIGGGFVAPLTVSNASDATAAAVEVRGVLEQDGVVVEERRATFDYVPGGGEAKGGLVFQRDPRLHQLRLSVEGYQDP